MSIHRSYAVFGLGRYGMAVAKELANHGAEVLAVDSDVATVDSAIAEIPFCKCADVTDPEVIRQLGIEDMDVVIVAMAGNLEASVMAVMLCKEVGAKTVIAKCGSELHKRILSKVGADRVVFPESESGVRLAKNLLSAGFIDIVELSSDVALIELEVKPEWVGKSLIELDLRRRYSINVIAIRSRGGLAIDIDPTAKLEAAMQLVIIADTTKLSALK